MGNLTCQIDACSHEALPTKLNIPIFTPFQPQAMRGPSLAECSETCPVRTHP